MDAAVHPHAAERIVEVCRVAGEKHAPPAIALRDALMHRVEGAVRDLVAAGFGVHAL